MSINRTTLRHIYCEYCFQADDALFLIGDRTSLAYTLGVTIVTPDVPRNALLSSLGTIGYKPLHVGTMLAKGSLVKEDMPLTSGGIFRRWSYRRLLNL